AAIRWGSGRASERGGDPAHTPYVGSWACNGDLGGYRQIAFEPATGGNDRPDPSAPPPLLAPGERLQWWLQIRALYTGPVPKVIGLLCRECGVEYGLQATHVCEMCFGPLDAVYDQAALK